jgi:hypothetical protein
MILLSGAPCQLRRRRLLSCRVNRRLQVDALGARDRAPAATYVCRFSTSHAFARSSSSSTTRASRSHIGSVQNILTTPFSSVTRSTFSSRSGLITRPHASHLSSFSFPISTPNHYHEYADHSADGDQQFPPGQTLVKVFQPNLHLSLLSL